MSYSNPTSWFLAVIVACAIVGEVDGQAASAVPSPDGATAVFVAEDYGFSGPDRIPAGVTTMQVVNQGKELHHIQVVRLLDGKTVADFLDALKADPARPPHWSRFMGGPNASMPGGQSTATMNLPEGQYLLLCVIPNRAGAPHVALGMLKPLLVQGRATVTAAEPNSTGAVTLTDFQFVVSSPIAAGRQTITVKNRGTQPHEIVVVQLAPGASMLDFAKAFEPGAAGPPPGRPIGGVVAIEPGDQAFFTSVFEPGRYGLICFLPDPPTGQPHFARGMTTEFTVK